MRVYGTVMMVDGRVQYLSLFRDLELAREQFKTWTGGWEFPIDAVERKDFARERCSGSTVLTADTDIDFGSETPPCVVVVMKSLKPIRLEFFTKLSEAQQRLEELRKDTSCSYGGSNGYIASLQDRVERLRCPDDDEDEDDDDDE